MAATDDPIAQALRRTRRPDPIALALERSSRPIISGGSTFEKALDVIGTPQQALFGLLTKTESESLLGAIERGTRQDLRFRDVLAQAGVPQGGDIKLGPIETSPRGIAGFVGDIILDPALILAGPAFRAGGAAARLGLSVSGRTIQRLTPSLSKAIVERVARPIAQRFSKVAFRGAEETRLVQIADEELGNFLRVRGNTLAEVASVDKLITQTAKRAGIPKSQADEIIGALIEEKRIAGQVVLPLGAGEPLLVARRPVEEIFAGVLDDLRKVEKFDPLQGPDDKLLVRLLKKHGVKKPTRQQIEIHKALAKLDREQERAIRLAISPPEQLVQQAQKTTRQLILPLGVSEQVSRTSRDVLDVAHKELAAVRLKATPEMRQIASALKQQQEGILAKEIRAGLQSVELQDARVDYLLHLMTPEAKRAVTQVPRFRQLGRQFTPAHASQLARELRGVSIQEINTLARSGNLPGFEGKLFNEFLVENPALLTAIREIRAAKAIADHNVITRSATEFGVPTASAPSHFVELSLARSTDPRIQGLAEGLQGLRFDPDVAAHLDSLVRTTALPEGLNAFVKTFDTVQGVWKSITLAIFPSYHLRNAVGNVWNNYLAGMGLGQADFYRLAGSIQRGTARTFNVGRRSFDIDEFLPMAKTLGVVGRGFVAGELPRAGGVAAGLVGFESQQIPLLGTAVRKGFAVGTKIEDNARLAHFLWRLDQGDTPIRAAASVKRYLFDYVTGLTDFERRFMRRVFPFYAWTRFNVPLQAQALVSNPRPFVRLAEVVNTIKATEPSARLDLIDKRLIPEFISEQVGIPIRTDQDGNPEYFLLGGWLPAADLEILTRPSGPLDRAVQLLSPFIKEPIEQLTNFDLFLNRKIEEFPGQKSKLLGLDVRRRVKKLTKIFRVLSEADRLLDAAKGDQLRELPTSKFGQALRTLFGLKTFTVDVGRQTLRLNFKQRELQRRLRSSGRRGDIANQEVLLEILIEGEN